ncbi:MAG: 50S ribosomal protein L16 [Patescibacteria group bacterium]|nr:50S ribosomal protein L16 [Patescibacteria group bacterium]
MLQPKKSKHRKQFRGKMKGVSTAGCQVVFGEFGLQSKDCGWVTSRQIEAARRAITSCIKRKGKVWIRIFPDKPVTKKPAEVKMGKGKGDIEEYVAVVRPGRIIFEIAGVEEDLAREAFRLATHKFNIATRFTERSGML